VRSTSENARLLVDILNEFGFAQSGFKESDFLKPGQLIQLGRVPTRIDLLTSITGVSSEQAFAGKFSAELDGIRVFVLGKDALVRNKRAVGRPQDLADIITLEKPKITCRRRTFDRTNVASLVAVLPQGPALRRVSLALQPALLFLA
jgi:hypothetical protein